MTIDLTNLVFENDFASFSLPSGDTLLLNFVDEDLQGEEYSAKINAINVQINFSDGTYMSCVNVIGLSDELISITTDYPDYNGARLNSDNYKFCKVVINE